MSKKPRRECCSCVHWERDGADGICWGGRAPNPQIVVRGEQYTLIWPRTNADQRCRDWEGADE